MIDRSGAVVRLGGGNSVAGLAWSADGREVWTTLAGDGPMAERCIRVLGIDGSRRDASLFVQRGITPPIRVDMVELATGAARPWRTLANEDLTGSVVAYPVHIVQGGDAYAYRVNWMVSDLYLMDLGPGIR